MNGADPMRPRINMGLRAWSRLLLRRPLRFSLYVLAVRDELDLAECMTRTLSQSTSHDHIASVHVFTPDSYWSGEPTSTEDKLSVERAVERVRLAHPETRVDWHVHRMAPFRIGARSRIEIERRMRNDTLDRLARMGEEHVLVMDADELWLPGLLAQVAKAVRMRAPGCVLSPMIPVVGLRGYPVQDAKDRATVYMSTRNRFEFGRHGNAPRHFLGERLLMHFTGVRKDAAALAWKVRNNGHFDDSSYSYERWLNEVVPSIRPGQRDIHAWQDHTVWPLVREWSPEELEMIPESIRELMA